MTPRRGRIIQRTGLLAVLTVAGAVMLGPAPARQADQPAFNPIARLLASGQPVFGIFSGDHTAEQGELMANNGEVDFVFYSLERPPFDIPTMQAYIQGMTQGKESHPIALRIPPIRDDRDAARGRVQEGLGAGVTSIVFPHVESAEDATLAVSSMGAELWPANQNGRLVNILIIEDKVGIQHAREIVQTPGVSIVFPGPGDLRRAYDGDMDAVEQAIQTVLSACKAFSVPCGITADAEDIAERLRQGFQVFIVRQPDALTAGRVAAGRDD